MSRPDWPQEALDRIESARAIKALRFFDMLPSTNDEALAWTGEVPAVFIAGEQTAGRGRRGHDWFATAGSLTFSIAVNPREYGFARTQTPIISLITGLAVCEALQPFTPESTIQVKWPNDVFIDGRKACGILIESQHEDRAVIGIGVNVNNPFDGADAEVRGKATSLAALTGVPVPLPVVLVPVLSSVLHYLDRHAAGALNLALAWRERCLLRGREIAIQAGTTERTGRCGGINEQGELLVATDDGVVHVHSGVVTRW